MRVRKPIFVVSSFFSPPIGLLSPSIALCRFCVWIEARSLKLGRGAAKRGARVKRMMCCNP